MKDRKKGRPSILGACPACGGKLLVMGTERRGHCLNRWAKCDACGWRLRYVQTPSGHKFRVSEAAAEVAPKATL